jgi:hypothetical protein
MWIFLSDALVDGSYAAVPEPEVVGGVGVR